MAMPLLNGLKSQGNPATSAMNGPVTDREPVGGVRFSDGGWTDAWSAPMHPLYRFRVQYVEPRGTTRVSQQDGDEQASDKDWRLRIQDIVDAISVIADYTAEHDLDSSFQQSLKTATSRAHFSRRALPPWPA